MLTMQQLWFTFLLLIFFFFLNKRDQKSSEKLLVCCVWFLTPLCTSLCVRPTGRNPKGSAPHHQQAGRVWLAVQQNPCLRPVEERRQSFRSDRSGGTGVAACLLHFLLSSRLPFLELFCVHFRLFMWIQLCFLFAKKASKEQFMVKCY